MTTRLLVFILAALSFCACKKKEKGSDPTVPEADSARKYTIFGLRDTVAIYEGDSTKLALTFMTSGKAEKLNLSIDGLPGGISATFSQLSGVPSFSSTLSINTGDERPGIYTATLQSATANHIKTNKIVVVILQRCDQALTGTFVNEDDTTDMVTVESTAPNRITVRKLLQHSFETDAYATLNCSSKTISIYSPHPAHPGDGTGTYTESTINLNMRIMTDGESKTYEDISVRLKRK